MAIEKTTKQTNSQRPRLSASFVQRCVQHRRVCARGARGTCRRSRGRRGPAGFAMDIQVHFTSRTENGTPGGRAGHQGCCCDGPLVGSFVATGYHEDICASFGRRHFAQALLRSLGRQPSRRTLERRGSALASPRLVPGQTQARYRHGSSRQGECCCTRRRRTSFKSSVKRCQG